jgi:peptidoglycan/LPS O-acetylase OafA/YrhL
VPVFSGHFWPLLATVVGLTAVAATMSWIVLERPLLRLKPRAANRARALSP